MKIREFQTELKIDAPGPKVFSFFADPSNLQILTPAWVNFAILTPLPVRMKKGALIDYKIRIRGVPVRWRTRITEWDPPFRFVDQQIRGPYRLWIHEHLFEPDGESTRIIDRVKYAVPFDFLFHEFFVKRDVQKIFAFRTRQLQKEFPTRD